MGNCVCCENTANGCYSGVKWTCRKIVCCEIPCQCLRIVRDGVLVPLCYCSQKACGPIASCVSASCFVCEYYLCCECCSDETKGSFGIGEDPHDKHVTSSFNFVRSYYDEEAIKREKDFEKRKEERESALKRKRERFD